MVSFYDHLEKKRMTRDDTEDAQSRQSVDKWIFRILLVLIGVMPLLVFGHVEQVISPLVSNVSTLASGTKGELFTHYKALFVVVITIITGAMLLAKVFFMNGSIKKTWLNYVLGAFTIAIIASTAFSPNISIALNGMYNRTDGAISWLCYIALMFIAMNIEYPKNIVKYIMYTLMPFVYINLYIITMNFYGKDVLQNNIVSRIVMSTLPEGASLGENSQLLGTLNQWNYMSGMFAMMTVMYLAWAITTKKWWEALIGTITAASSVLIMFMSISTSGFLTVAVCLPILLIVAIRVKRKTIAALAIGLFILISVPSFNILAEKNPRVWDESFGFIFKDNPYQVDETFSLFETKSAYASNNSFELPILSERGWGAGSGRIYIWEKTVDLAIDRPLFGYGLDTIIYNFPHFNLDARTSLWTEETIVDKPHNLYIGIFYGTGILGVLSILTLLLINVIFIVRSIIMKNWDVIILSLLGFAFFIQSMFNDSLPSITSIAFLIMGISFGLFRNAATNITGKNT